jgi:hypothetical protein
LFKTFEKSKVPTRISTPIAKTKYPTKTVKNPTAYMIKNEMKNAAK